MKGARRLVPTGGSDHATAAVPWERRAAAGIDEITVEYRLPFFRGGDQGWRDDARCLGLIETDPELHACFFSDSVADQKRAKALCKECPVKKQCEAAGAKEVTGIWGGRGVRERQRQAAAKRGKVISPRP